MCTHTAKADERYIRELKEVTQKRGERLGISWVYCCCSLHYNTGEELPDLSQPSTRKDGEDIDGVSAAQSPTDGQHTQTCHQLQLF